ncbi:MAG: CBS domain-containing protein [Deltaproteobacteria bacterium]
MAPSLFVGVMSGGTFGWLAGTVLPEASAVSSYALVGMGALLAGTTHAPVTAILLVFELSGRYHIVLPLLIACILSTITASLLKRESIYSLKLLRRGVEISHGREQKILRSIKVSDVMVSDVKSVLESTPVVKVVEFFKKFNLSCLSVVNHKGELVGMITFHDITDAAWEEEMSYLLIARDLADTEVDAVVPTDTLDKVLEKMEEAKVGQLPVLAEDGSRKLIGLVVERDVLNAYESELRQRWI